MNQPPANQPVPLSKATSKPHHPLVWDRILRVSVSLALIGGAGMLLRWSARPEPPQKPPSGPIRPIVETAPALEHSGEFIFEADGEVVPYREIEIAAEVGGRVIHKAPACRAGYSVAAGELLFQLDPRDYDLEIRRLQAELEQAESAIDELEVEESNLAGRIQLAQEDLEIRRRELKRLETAESMVFSKQEIDAARRSELQARDLLQTQQDQLRTLATRRRRTEGGRELVQAMLDRSRLERSRCDVKAPIDGVVTAEQVEQDGFVQKGGVLVSIRDTSRMEVECSLRMRQLSWLWGDPEPADQLRDEPPNPDTADPGKDSPVTSQVAAAASHPEGGGLPLPEVSDTVGSQVYDLPPARATVIFELDGVSYAWHGRLSRLAEGSVDPQTRMIPSIVEVASPRQVFVLGEARRATEAPRTLLSGMFVKVRFHAHPRRPLVRLPVEAVGPGGQVWSVREGRLHRVRALVVHADESRVLAEAQADLGPGELVVVSPMTQPFEGAEVQFADLDEARR